MRAYQFILLEYRRDITAQKFGDRLVQAALRDRRQTLDEILNALESMDPTRNKQYVVWLSNQYIHGKFRLEDVNRIRQVLTNFESLKPRLQQRDINQYDFYKLEDTIDKITNPQLGTEPIENTFEIPADTDVLYNGPYGLLAVPKTEKASCELGSGTKWCTAAEEDNSFRDYPGPLYIWRDRSGKKYQFHFESTQFMDSQNRPIDSKLLNYFRTEHPVLKKLFSSEEHRIAESDPRAALDYATKIIKGRWPEAEENIASDPYTAYDYAYDVIKGRWPEAEKSIMKDSTAAYNYALKVLRDRWPDGESAILDDPDLTKEYIKNVIRGRWPEVEKKIATEPLVAIWYAKEIIGGRWPEAEKYIKTNPRFAYEYAKDVLHSRWPEAEHYIMRNERYRDYYVKEFSQDKYKTQNTSK